MNQNTNNKKVSLKFIGEEAAVLEALVLVEKQFPLSVRSKICSNSDKLGVHVWLSVAVPAQ